VELYRRSSAPHACWWRGAQLSTGTTLPFHSCRQRVSFCALRELSSSGDTLRAGRQNATMECNN
jgi:hypothetical protein